MPGQLRARVGVAMMLGALWVSALAAPVSAAGAVRWVDNDSNPGDGPTKCDTAPYHTIQSAINNSNPYDTIYVCPGTYRQALHVDVKGLHIESINYRKAKIMPPTSYGANFPALVSISARDVEFWNFLMPIAGGPLQIVGPFVGGGGGVGPSCETTFVAIEVLGPNADIRGNYLKGTGDYTFSGACGYLYGIVVAAPSLPGMIPDVSGPNVSSISHNRILDFKYAGVLAVGDVQARIVRNAVRFVHEDDPATCVLTPVLGVTAELTFPCQVETARIETGVNGAFSQAIGIGAEGGPLVEIRNNTVYSTFDQSLLIGLPVQGGIPGPGPDTSIFLSGGIAMLDVADGSTARNNTVSNVGFGLLVANGGISGVTAAEPADNPNGSKFTGNRLYDSFFGLAVAGDDNVFYGNRARTNFAGTFVIAGQNNLFHANDFRFNMEIDCFDGTTGTGDAGTANLWTNGSAGRYNFGQYNQPEEICIPTLNPI